MLNDVMLNFDEARVMLSDVMLNIHKLIMLNDVMLN
jgi:hypothetical protein